MAWGKAPAQGQGQGSGRGPNGSYKLGNGFAGIDRKGRIRLSIRTQEVIGYDVSLFLNDGFLAALGEWAGKSSQDVAAFFEACGKNVVCMAYEVPPRDPQTPARAWQKPPVPQQAPPTANQGWQKPPAPQADVDAMPF